MAEDDRPTDAGKLKRRGKAPTLTLEATDITPAEPASSEQVAPEAVSSVAVAETGDPAPAGIPQDASPESISAEAVVGDISAQGSAGETAAAAIGEAPAAEPAAGSVPPPEAGSEAAPVRPEQPASGAEAAPPRPSDAPAQPVHAAEAAPPASPPPGRQGAGFGGLVAAGVIGALLTAGLGAGAMRLGLLSPRAPDPSALEARLAALDRRLGELAARPAPSPAPSAAATGAPLDISPLNQRLETLDAARAALEARIAALESRPQPEPAAAPAAAPPPVDLDPINREIGALRTALGRIEEAQRQVAAAPAPAAAPAGPDMAAVTAVIEERLREALLPEGRRVEAVEGRVTELSTALTRQSEALDGRIAALAGDLGKQAEAGQAAAQRLAALDQSRSLGEKAARLVGVEVLRAAVERGGAYAAELRGALALGIEASGLEPLSAAAERGIPSRAALHRGFAALAPQLVRAAPGSGEGGFLDRLASNAQGLVRVRPVGEAAGGSVPAVVARIEAKLGRGDLAGALADFDSLPEPVKAPAQDWSAGAKARLAAERALAKLSSDALAALSAR